MIEKPSTKKESLLHQISSLVLDIWYDNQIKISKLISIKIILIKSFYDSPCNFGTEHNQVIFNSHSHHDFHLPGIFQLLGILVACFLGILSSNHLCIVFCDMSRRNGLSPNKTTVRQNSKTYT